MKRKVKVFKSVYNGSGKFKKVFHYIATFHQFGVDFEEFETGPGNFTTAIVEKADGTVKNVPAEMILFVEPTDLETA